MNLFLLFLGKILGEMPPAPSKSPLRKGLSRDFFVRLKGELKRFARVECGEWSVELRTLICPLCPLVPLAKGCNSFSRQRPLQDGGEGLQMRGTTSLARMSVLLIRDFVKAKSRNKADAPLYAVAGAPRRIAKFFGVYDEKGTQNPASFFVSWLFVSFYSATTV